MIQVLNAIYGGERFKFDGTKLVDKGINLPGFLLDKSGVLKASGAEISGHIEANSGTFKGDLLAGTLKATGLEISAPVTAGTNYLIKSNNFSVSSMGMNTENLDVKEIFTAAQGQVTLQLKFINGNGHQYRIKVNETVSINWTNLLPNNLNTIISHTLNLPNNTVNKISLDYKISSAQTSITNTTFRIMSNTNPKFLSLLG
jgi:hypothetical protein